jgi:hypothetical protein
VKGETLWKIAERHGDGKLRRRSSANRDVVKDLNAIGILKPDPAQIPHSTIKRAIMTMLVGNG